VRSNSRPIPDVMLLPRARWRSVVAIVATSAMALSTAGVRPVSSALM
jgi:hypothetical protein